MYIHNLGGMSVLRVHFHEIHPEREELEDARGESHLLVQLEAGARVH